MVRLTLDGETRWMDPTCDTCAPFELPAELQGASALGPGVDATPAPTPGQWRVEIDDDAVRWTLEGPPAQQLRAWLAEVPDDRRAAALAARIGGPDARLAKVEGADVAGEPFVAVASRGDGALTDPLELPVARADGTVWVPWVGQRQVRWVGRAGEPVEGSAGPLSWRRTVEDGALVEVLEVSDRAIAAEHAAAWDAARAR